MPFLQDQDVRATGFMLILYSFGVLAIAINQEKEIKLSKKEKGGGWREIEMIEIERL